MHGLYQVKSFDEDYNGSDDIMNLPQVSSLIDLIGVHIRITDDNYEWVRKVRIVRDLPTDDFSSGIGIRFLQPVRQGRLRIVYKAPFTALTAESQNLVTYAGLPATCEDIVNLGVQIRMMAPRELKRNFTESQGDTRRPDEVASGAVTNSITNLLRMRRDRITAEAHRLQRLYPTYLTRD
jgi:hypothetical protein